MVLRHLAKFGVAFIMLDTDEDELLADAEQLDAKALRKAEKLALHQADKAAKKVAKSEAKRLKTEAKAAKLAAKAQRKAEKQAAKAERQVVKAARKAEEKLALLAEPESQKAKRLAGAMAKIKRAKSLSSRRKSTLIVPTRLKSKCCKKHNEAGEYCKRCPLYWGEVAKTASANGVR